MWLEEKPQFKTVLFLALCVANAGICLDIFLIWVYECFWVASFLAPNLKYEAEAEKTQGTHHLVIPQVPALLT